MCSSKDDTLTDPFKHSIMINLNYINPAQFHFNGKSENGEISSNFTIVSNDLRETLGMEYFVMDENDLQWINGKFGKNQEENGERAAVLKNLTEFVTQKPDKVIYLRHFEPFVNGHLERLFLVDDVIEIIHLLQQNRKKQDISTEIQGEIEKYCGKQEDGMKLTISQKDLKNLFNEMDFDTDWITIINDLEFTHNAENFFSSRQQCLYSGDHYGRRTVFPSSAITFILQKLVCGINWRIQVCQKHPDCLQDYRSEIMMLMEKYSNLDKTILVPYTSVLAEIEDLESHCSWQKQHHSSDGDLDYELKKHDPFNIYIRSKENERVCRKFGLENFRKLSSKIAKEDEKLVYMTRLCWTLGWMESFFNSSTETFKAVLDGVFDLCEPDHFNGLRRFLNKRYNIGYELHGVDEDIEKSELSEIRWHMVPASHVSVRDTNPSPTHDRCKHCFETIGKFKKLENELKAAQKKAEEYEKQAMKTKQLEEDLKRLHGKKKNADKNRITEKKKKDAAEKFAADNKEKIENAKKTEEALKEMEKKYKNECSKVNELENKLTTLPDLKLKIDQLEKSREQREKVVTELRESNSWYEMDNKILKKQVKQQMEKVENLQEKFTEDYQKMMEEMTKMRRVNEQLNSKIVSLGNNNAQLTSRNTRLTTEFSAKVKHLEHELKVIRNSEPSSCSKNNKKPGSSWGPGVPDTHCLICHQLRELTAECDKCLKVYHKTCLTTWFQQENARSRCPHCMQTVVDKKEFPELRK